MKRAHFLLVPLLIAAAGSVAAAREDVTVSVLQNLTWRNIGPANMMGRVADVEGVPGMPEVVYFGSASGGVFKTTNGGVTWKPIFDEIEFLSIGDIALEPGNPDVVYVGTGEGNPRNSVSFGNGVYKTTDGGKTWKHLGLSDTERITRIVIDPKNPANVYVGALGHIFGPNEERGVFVSRDAGESWEKTLYSDERHGVADLDIDGSNGNVLFAALWSFDRKPWTHTSGSEKGGVFKSVDAGRTWNKIEKGLPTLLGRIGVKVAQSNPSIVYVIGESHEGSLYRSEDQGETFTKVYDDPDIVNRGLYYTDLRVDPTDENRLYAVSSTLRLSIDGGKTFEQISPTTHVDYHALWIDPANPNRIWQGQDGGVAVSHDRGKTWEYENHVVLAQFYQIYVDNRQPFYYLGGGLQDNGTWSGPSRTREPFGILNEDWRMVSFGDGFHIVSHPDDPELFLSEYQGGGLYRTDMKTRDQIAASPQPRRGDGGPVGNLEYRFNWNAPIVASPFDARTVYFGGNVVFRTDDFGFGWQPISPDLTTNDPEKLQSAGGPVFIENTTAEYHATVISVAESPMEAGILWAGTDDGNLQLTKDGGASWVNVVSNVPDLGPFSPVSHVEPSRTSPGTAYAAFDRHMFDDFAPYIYKTSDFGSTWNRMTSGLPPRGYVHVVREDPKNARVLYAGTEIGLFVSLDGGGSWGRFPLDKLPAVSVHDIVVHPRDNDLILGTHGRGLYILDDAGPIQALTDVFDEPAHLFDVRPALRFTMKPTRYGIGDEPFRGPNPPYGALITYRLAVELEDDDTLEVEILDANGTVLRALKDVPKDAGIHRVSWDLAAEEPRPRTDEGNPSGFFAFGPRGPQVPPGVYRVRLTAGATVVEKPIEVRLDPTVVIDSGVLEKQYELTTELRDLRSSVNDALRGLDSLKTQMEERKKTYETQKTEIPEAVETAIDSAVEKLDGVFDRLARPSGKPFWSEGPRLSERLGGMFGDLNGVLTLPTPAQLAYLAELRSEYRTEMAEVNRFLAETATPLSQALVTNGAPGLMVPPTVVIPE
ncbi:MAG TPA: glycosyl hydrolase [Vicinamibacteria bacterium]|nr:glycosyl hydrolase [Vicinamibacteria bacterium]